MEQSDKQYNFPPFNEEEWIRLVFLLNDTQKWLDGLIDGAFLQLPVTDRKKLFKRTYHLSVGAMAHVIERHYHKVQRHPGTGKFTVPLADVLAHIRDAGQSGVTAITGSCNFYRSIGTGTTVGFDKSGKTTSVVTIITGPSGSIVTAFPGNIQ